MYISLGKSWNSDVCGRGVNGWNQVIFPKGKAQKDGTLKRGDERRGRAGIASSPASWRAFQGLSIGSFNVGPDGVLLYSRIATTIYTDNEFAWRVLRNKPRGFFFSLKGYLWEAANISVEEISGIWKQKSCLPNTISPAQQQARLSAYARSLLGLTHGAACTGLQRILYSIKAWNIYLLQKR